jgi:serine/threonine protein kinase
MSDLAGQQIRGYDFREKIGSGGYGAVYRAYQPSVDREVAIKIVLPEHASQPEFARRFESEAHLIAKLEHPHVVPLYDYWQDETGAFLVMRMLKGGSLRDLLVRQGALPPNLTARILSQIADALSAAHQCSIIHRDLKPDNILLDERGNAYLSDFGIAKNTASEISITGTDVMVGTPAYLSPEQIQSQPLTSRTDIYSLGILLYEMLAGTHPFADSGYMVVMKHLEAALPSIQEQRKELPASIDGVLQRATAKNPQERYADATEVAREFDEAVKALPHQTASAVSRVPREVLVSKPRSGTQNRNRRNILYNIELLWIKGVLENSLSGNPFIQLDVSPANDYTERTWDGLLKTPGMPDQAWLPDVKIVDVFNQYNGKLLILGHPGSGKTTTLLELTRDLLKQAESQDDFPIPLVLNLSTWGTKRIPLKVWLVNEMVTRYQTPRRVAQEWVDSDSLILLLDGLDEVAPQHRDVCIQAVNEYRAEHGFVDVVVCSRIADYESLTRRLNLNGAIIIEALSPVQVDAYLMRLEPATSALRQILRTNSTLLDIARTPLMLNVLILAYQNVSIEAIPQSDSPESLRSGVFDLYVERMTERRAEGPTYSLDETRHYIGWLAGQMQRSNLATLYVEQLQPNWLPQPYRKWYQNVDTLLLLLFTGVVLLLALSTPWAVGLFPIIVFGTVFLFRRYILNEQRLRLIQIQDRLRYKIEQEDLELVIPMAVTLFLMGIPVFALTTSLALLAVSGLKLRSGRSIELYSQPTAVIVRRAVRNTLLIALAWAIMGGLAWGLAWGFQVPRVLQWGLVCALIGGLFYVDGIGLLKYLVLRLLLRVSGKTPWNYSRFLDYAASHILLRKVGNGYTFIHRLMLEYFATHA